MSETDEITGFEFLDEDALIETVSERCALLSPLSETTEAPDKPQNVLSEHKRSLNLGLDKIACQATATKTASVPHATCNDSGLSKLSSSGGPTTMEKTTDHNDGTASTEDTSSTLNTEIVWTGLQWGASFISRVTEKAKESVDRVITTLDPQMKPIIFSGGDLTVFVATDSSHKIAAVQDAFWDVFGRATVEGVSVPPSSLVPVQPSSILYGVKAAETRVQELRASNSTSFGSAVQSDSSEFNQDATIRNSNLKQVEVPFVAIESFITEFSTNQWNEMSVLLLEDSENNIILHTFTQPTPICNEWLQTVQRATPRDYPLSWCGFAESIETVASDALCCKTEEWHEKHVGISEAALIYHAARSLAFLYRHRLRQLIKDQRKTHLIEQPTHCSDNSKEATGCGGVSKVASPIVPSI